MMNLVLGAVFLIVVLIGYGIIYPDLAGKPTYKRIMRSAFLCMAWSITLTLVALFATKSGIAEMTPLATIFWSFAFVMSSIIGAVALVGAFGLWATHKINPQPETQEKDSPESETEQ
ncbi:MAG: hypothetical protein Q7S52_06010 [bacterium]|nr:hypothetical protein [bacterium]